MVQIGVAPMEGVTNFPMRLWLQLTSAPESLATPFLRVTPTYPLTGLPASFAPELAHAKLPYHLVPQLMATDAEDFLRVAPEVLAHAPLIELNCGCPSPTCVGKGAGSSMLRDVDAWHRTLRRLTTALGPGRLAVKMRTGYLSESEFPALLAAALDLPLARLTVHGRTRPDGYTGSARWDLIDLAARTLSYPVYASGDVVDRHSLEMRLGQAPTVAGVLIGRGVIRHPWIFAELRLWREIELSQGTLIYSLATFALLCELNQTDPEALIHLVRDGLGSVSLGTDEQLWEQALQLVGAKLYRRRAMPSLAAAGSHLSASSDLSTLLPVSRQSLGRVKLLWNYLRATLPEAYFAPLTMRAKDLGALLLHLHALHRSAGAPRLLPLRHAPAYDWLYGGERRQKQNAAGAAGS